MRYFKLKNAKKRRVPLQNVHLHIIFSKNALKRLLNSCM